MPGRGRYGRQMGAGPAGGMAALTAAELGLRTALVEVSSMKLL